MLRSTRTTSTSPLLLLLALLLGLSGLSACHSSPSKRALQYMNQEGFGRRYTGNAEEEDYVTIGDGVTIFDVNHPELDLNRTVGPDGTILMPEIGRIHIAGYTRSDLESVLAERYSAYYMDPPSIVVDITTRKKIFWVLGEVKQEGEVVFEGNQTVFDAVIAAEPMRDTANLGRVMLVRADPNDPLRLPVNINDIRRGDSTTNYTVQENDIIWVPPTLFAEFGYFLRAALYPVTAVFQAIGGALFATQGQRNGNNNRNLLSFGGFF